MEMTKKLPSEKKQMLEDFCDTIMINRHQQNNNFSTDSLHLELQKFKEETANIILLKNINNLKLTKQDEA